MNKIILKNYSDLGWSDFLLLANKVISLGRVSNHERQYSYLVSFYVDGREYHIVSDINKGSDKLTIYNVPEKRNEKK